MGLLDRAVMLLRFFFSLLCTAVLAAEEAVTLRLVAANLSSVSTQAWSPDNGNHSNPEGAGARILKALKPDVVMIQEFNTTIPVRQWVNRTFGQEFSFYQEEGKQIPNGVISRFPIIASGSWDDPQLDNREFAWARLRLPGDREMWVVSVHFHSKGSASRTIEAAALAHFVRATVPTGAMLAIGGDYNTRSVDEACFAELKGVVVHSEKPPADENGDITTNVPRNRPYDWVLASEALDKLEIPVVVAGKTFPNGLVFDTRVFTALEKCPPAQVGDSEVKHMQHMAVVRDFRIP